MYRKVGFYRCEVVYCVSALWICQISSKRKPLPPLLNSKELEATWNLFFQLSVTGYWSHKEAKFTRSWPQLVKKSSTVGEAVWIWRKTVLTPISEWQCHLFVKSWAILWIVNIFFYYYFYFSTHLWNSLGINPTFPEKEAVPQAPRSSSAPRRLIHLLRRDALLLRTGNCARTHGGALFDAVRHLSLLTSGFQRTRKIKKKHTLDLEIVRFLSRLHSLNERIFWTQYSVRVSEVFWGEALGLMEGTGDGERAVNPAVSAGPAW